MNHKTLLIASLTACIVLAGCSTKSTIPDDCTSRFDGCNTCMVKDGKIGGCTRMACPAENTAEPKCLESQTKEKTIPSNCTSRFDGCNNCTVESGETKACTLKFCEKNEEAKCTQTK